MKSILKIILFSALFCSQTLMAANAEHVLWEKAPIRIQLPIGEERIVSFPAPISIVDSELEDKEGVL